MAVFTAIATAIVGAITGLGYAAVAAAGTFSAIGIATSVLAGTLAITASSLYAKRMAAKAGRGQGGGRVQLPPATDNKIPVIYGTAYVGGPVTDAKISTDLKTMWYVVALAEHTDTTAGSGYTYDTSEIYYDNKKVQFGSAGVVTGLINNTPGQTEINTNVNGKIRIWLFTNGYNSCQNVPGANAQTILSDPRIPIYQRWTATDTMNNCAFAIVRVDYDTKAGTTALGGLMCKITNSLTAPGSVIKDYMLNTRYGCAIPLARIDTDSLDDLNTYSAVQIPYTYQSVNYTQDRYKINGPVVTQNNCLTNLQELVDSCDSWLQYSELTGKWKVVINKAYDQVPDPTTISNLFLVDSSNLVGGINIAPINLNETYNELEVSYPNNSIKDQTDFQVIQLQDYVPEVMSPNEAVNKLDVDFSLVNNAVQAKYLAIRRLLQSREDLTITFQLDYSGIQVEAGDVIRVKHEEYGWDVLNGGEGKLFRVATVNEEKYPDGSLGTTISALEYNNTIYANFALEDFRPDPNTGLTDPNIIHNPGTPIVANNPDSSGSVTSFRVTSAVPEVGSVLNMDFNYGNSSNINTHVLYRTISSAAGTKFDNSIDIANNIGVNNIYVDINDLPADSYYFSVVARNDYTGATSNVSNVFVWAGAGFNPVSESNLGNVFSSGNIITSTNSIPNLAVGANIFLTAGTGDLAANTYVTLINSTTPANFEVTPTPITPLANANIIAISGGINGNAITPNTMPGNRVTPNTLPGNTLIGNTVNGNVIIGNTLPGNTIIANTVNGNVLIGNSVNGNVIIGNSLNGNAIIGNSLNGNVLIGNSVNGNVIIGNSVNGNVIIANTLNGNTIQANTINGNTIIANTVNGNTIVANTLNGNTITANTLNGNTIIANTINGNTIKANTLNGNTIIANTVDGNTIIADTLDGNTIKANTVNGNTIIANTLNGNRIQANTLNGNTIIANTMNGNVILANTVNGNTIRANTLNGNTIIANTVDGNTIIADTLDGNTIKANTINGNSIQANTINGNRIQANTLNGNTIIANTVNGNTIIADTLDGNTIKANTLNGNTVIANTLNGNRIQANTLNGNTVIANTLNGNTIQANTLNGNTIIANTIDGNTIIAGTVTGIVIAANTLNGNTIIANTLNGNTIIANTIDGNTIKANTLSGNTIIANTLNGNSIQANTVNGNVILANTLNGNTITANTLNGNTIIANTMNGNVIIANTLNGNSILANTVNGNVIIANTLNGNTITANTLNGNTIIANTMNGNVFIANTINGNAIQANTVNGNTVIANTLNGNSIQAFSLNGGVAFIAGTIQAQAIAANTITFENLAIGAVTQSRSTLSDPIVKPIPFTNIPNVWPANTRCVVPSGGVTIVPSTDPGSSANTEYTEGSRIQVSYSVKMYVDPGNVANTSQNWDQYNLVEIWKSGASSTFDRGYNTIRQAYDVTGNATSASNQQLHALGYAPGGSDLYSDDGGNTWQIYNGNSTSKTITGAMSYTTTSFVAYPRGVESGCVGPLQTPDSGSLNSGLGSRVGAGSAPIIWDQDAGTNAVRYQTTSGGNVTAGYQNDFLSMEFTPYTGGNGYPYTTGNAGYIFTGTNGDIFYSPSPFAPNENTTNAMRRENVPNLLKDLYASYSNPEASGGNTYTAVIVGQTGTILRSARTRGASDFANSWTAKSVYIGGNTSQPLLTDLYAVAGDDTDNSPATSKWCAVGQYGMIQVSQDDGDSWTQVNIGANVTCDFNGVRYGNGKWVTVGDGGNIYVSSNIANANAWSQISTSNLNYTNGTNYGSIYGNSNNSRQLNTVNYNGEWDTWSIGGQGIILYSNDNANTFKVAYEESPSETYDLTRVTFFGSWPNVANVSRPPAEQRILNNQIFSGTILDTGYVAGQETTYYLVIGNMNGNTIQAGQIFLQVQEIKR